MSDGKISGRFNKSEICRMYRISATTLGRLLNEKYFSALEAHQYEKNQKDLSPRQFEIFKEKYGEPFLDSDKKDS